MRGLWLVDSEKDCRAIASLGVVSEANLSRRYILRFTSRFCEIIEMQSVLSKMRTIIIKGVLLDISKLQWKRH